jgi:choline dehydrogenase-like flavoprotein
VRFGVISSVTDRLPNFFDLNSGLNGTLMIRGSKADYDNWAAMGNEGWSWNDVLPLFKKVCKNYSVLLENSDYFLQFVFASGWQSERFIPTEGFDAALEYHGTDGPLRTTVHPLAPISNALLESYIDKGFEYKPDMFVAGEGEGVGHVTRTVHEGLRTSG